MNNEHSDEMRTELKLEILDTIAVISNAVDALDEKVCKLLKQEGIDLKGGAQ